MIGKLVARIRAWAGPSERDLAFERIDAGLAEIREILDRIERREAGHKAAEREARREAPPLDTSLGVVEFEGVASLRLVARTPAGNFPIDCSDEDVRRLRDALPSAEIRPAAEACFFTDESGRKVATAPRAGWRVGFSATNPGWLAIETPDGVIEIPAEHEGVLRGYAMRREERRIEIAMPQKPGERFTVRLWNVGRDVPKHQYAPPTLERVQFLVDHMARGVEVPVAAYMFKGPEAGSR